MQDTKPAVDLGSLPQPYCVDVGRFGVIYTDKQMLAERKRCYELGASPAGDCRTCVNFRPFRSGFMFCASLLRCVDGREHKPSERVRLWESSPTQAANAHP